MNRFRPLALALLLAVAAPAAAQSVGSSITFQGELRAAGAPANAAYDFQFRLYSSPSGTTQLGAQVSANAVTVSNGLFSVPLDFGPAQFAGDAQWLEISVRPAGGGAFETLSPRTAVTATPYALGAVAALANSVTTTSVVDGTLQFSDVNAAQFQARVSGTCSGSQGIQSIAANGTVVCGTFGGGGGSITGVVAGTGLAGGGTSGSVTLGIAAGGVGSAQVNPAQVQLRVTGTCPSGQFMRQVGQGGNVECSSDATGSDWSLVGNAGTNPSTNFIGTTDAQPLVLRTGNAASLRLEPSANVFGDPPLPATSNLVAGSVANSTTAGVRGATIAGGGTPTGDSDPEFAFEGPNRVTDHYGTVSGGFGNTAGNASGATADAPFATVGGGWGNVAQANASVIAGGANNATFGTASAIVGGFVNVATGTAATAGGGVGNCAGGDRSWAGGFFAAVRPAQTADDGACPGVARTTDADGDEGTFVWADAPASFVPFVSTGPNEFLVRAEGGFALNGAPASPSVEMSVYGNDTARSGGFANVFLREAGADLSNAGILLSAGGASNTAGSNNAGLYVDQANLTTGVQQRRLSVEPSGTVRIDPSTRLEFGSQTRQMINLWGPAEFGIGVQSDTQYFRSNANFGWFQAGSHVDGALNPGAGGALLMSLTTSPISTNPFGFARAQSFVNVSDRAAKDGFSAIDPLDVLGKVVAMPLSRWFYRNAPDQWHIGPVAQDFFAAFNLGGDEQTISTVDADGVALAAIQGLNAKLEAERDALAADVARLQQDNATLRDEAAVMRARMDAIEARIGGRP